MAASHSSVWVPGIFTASFRPWPWHLKLGVTVDVPLHPTSSSNSLIGAGTVAPVKFAVTVALRVLPAAAAELLQSPLYALLKSVTSVRPVKASREELLRVGWATARLAASEATRASARMQRTMGVSDKPRASRAATATVENGDEELA